MAGNSHSTDGGRGAWAFYRGPLHLLQPAREGRKGTRGRKGRKTAPVPFFPEAYVPRGSGASPCATPSADWIELIVEATTSDIAASTRARGGEGRHSAGAVLPRSVKARQKLPTNNPPRPMAASTSVCGVLTARQFGGYGTRRECTSRRALEWRAVWRSESCLDTLRVSLQRRQAGTRATAARRWGPHC